MNKLPLLVAAFCVTWVSFAEVGHGREAPILIARQGKSAFSILVPPHAPASVLEAAHELQRDVAEATGAQLPLLAEPAELHGPCISLGETSLAKAVGVSAKGIALEGFRIITRDGNICIAGPDTPDGEYTATGGRSNGTANGVYTFLEDCLGVRWLMPGELGRDVPQKATLSVEAMDRTESPVFFGRRMPFMQNSEPAVVRWADRQKLGCSINVTQRPTWKQTVPPGLFQTHPEWFPLVGGKRTIDDHNYKLETTDPGLVKHFAQTAITSLKARPSQYVFSISPTDFPGGWSESEASKALYDQPRWGYQMTTTLMLKFYHDVAEIVARDYPQGRLGGYIYDVYKAPPTNPQGRKYLPLPANFYPALANNGDYGYRLYQERNRKELEELLSFWTKQSPQLTYYGIPNRLDVTSGILLPPAPGILNYLFSQINKYPVKGILLYGNTSWSEGAMGNWIIARMMWNPHLDARELQREWLIRAYGEKAGATMDQLYTKLDGWFDQYYQARPSGYLYNLSDELLRSVYAAHYPEIERLFLQARGETRTAPQQARLGLLEDNLVLLQNMLRGKRLLSADFASPLQRDEAQIRQLLRKSYPDFQLFPKRLS